MSVPSWRINALVAQRLMARHARRKTRAVIDYEHQTLRTEENGQPAPAAGWIAALEWREGSGLWARAEFTERAAKHIAAREYRYVSPVFRYHEATGEVLDLLMAAITNNPAIDGMAPMELQAAASAAFNQAQIEMTTSHPKHLTPAELAVCNGTGVTPEAFASAREASTATHGLSAEELAMCSRAGVSPQAFAATKAQASANESTHGLSAEELAVCSRTGVDAKDYAATKYGRAASKLTDAERAIARSAGITDEAFMAARQNSKSRGR